MTSSTRPAEEHVRSLLERDRVWCAYALADLEPRLAPLATWILGAEAVLLVFRGLTPPLLFAHGDPAEVEALADGVPPGRYQYGLLATHRARLAPRLRFSREVQMWRMVLRPERFPVGEAEAGIERLGTGDLAALYELFDDHPDRPDSFEPSQLEDGVFFGVRQEGKLVAVAGTHVVAPGAGVAAVGNVFTRPSFRGRGLARRATNAVVAELLRRQLRTIVLNVARDNAAALTLYRRLGFLPFCGYYEGVAELSGSRPQAPQAP